ncbi:MAG: hypothetical protein KAH10_07780 [Flavobacteriales bacterium]|nr:hypothetical protein [Flavobacteriales bacterium]
MDFNKYITNKNVAILGTLTFHVLLFAIFTHTYMRTSTVDKETLLLINFIEQRVVEQEQEEVIQEKEVIYDEFTDPSTNQASSRSNENTVEELRASMKSLEGAREISNSDENVDLFSEAAAKREIKIKHLEKEADTGKGESERKADNAFTGRSTVNFYLENRYSDKMPNPIYTCIDGGLVYIDIKVNQNGRVIEASYNKGKSTTNNECLKETALKYAKRARFNSDYSAKETQKGFISYKFQVN